MNRRANKEWFASVFLVITAIISLELDKLLPISRSLHYMIIGIALILTLSALANYIYQRAKTSTKSSKHAWWLDDDNWSNWGGI